MDETESQCCGYKHTLASVKPLPKGGYDTVQQVAESAHKFDVMSYYKRQQWKQQCQHKALSNRAYLPLRVSLNGNGSQNKSSWH